MLALQMGTRIDDILFCHQYSNTAGRVSCFTSPQLVELKNGETYNGHLVSCDNWMNINLREVICTSRVKPSPVFTSLRTFIRKEVDIFAQTNFPICGTSKDF